MQHEPIGHLGDDIRTARLANIIAQVNGNKTQLADFLPQYTWPDPAAEAEPDFAQMRAELEALYGS
jgi:hypothetical protein